MSASDRRARIEGLLLGSLVGDSLALGAHWIYDQGALRRDYGRITELLDPRADSYHPTKKHGQQTHYGDQALTLMASIEARAGFQFDGFAEDWPKMWEGYGDYRDHATKETLGHLAEGVPPDRAASTSDELGGAARIAPLLAFMANDSLESALAAARAQTGLTHGSPLAGNAAEFFTRLVFALLEGAPLRTAVDGAGRAFGAELEYSVMRRGVEDVKASDIAAAAQALGLACPTPQAMPTLLLLLDRCGKDFETALIENTNAGGDNAARGLALGMILGAAHGRAAIPSRWLQGLAARPRVEAFLAKLP